MNDVEFGKQLELSYNKIYGMLVKMTNNIDTAKDLIQDTMLRAWTFRHQFNGTSAFSTWLGTIAINVFRSKLRSKFKKSFINFSDLVPEEVEGTDRSVDEILGLTSNEDNEQQVINKDLVKKLFQQAGVSQKTLMIAKMYDRSPEKLGISEDAWKARKFRAQHESRSRMQQLNNGKTVDYEVRSNEKKEARRLNNIYGGLRAAELKTGVFAPGAADKGRQRTKELKTGIYATGVQAEAAKLGGLRAKELGKGVFSPGAPVSGNCMRWNINRGKPCVCGKHT